MKVTSGELAQILTAIAAVGSWVSSCINNLLLKRIHKDTKP